MDWKLELVAVPVSDVDAAKAFYVEKVGFNADHDHRISDEIRFVADPARLGVLDRDRDRHHEAAPGAAQGLQLVVDDAARAQQLIERGVDASDVQSFPWGDFVFFRDLDGNGWAVYRRSGSGPRRCAG